MKSLKLHYQKIGNNPKILLAFHGMGQDFSCFQNFAQTFENQYTTYLFDLPYHGKSVGINGNNYVKNEIITKEIWKEYLAKFLAENNVQNFSVIGFSIGGRFALATVETFTERIEELILLAPDGVTEDPKYILATRYGFTRKIFKYVVQNNAKYHTFADLLARRGIVHKKVVKFAKMMVDSPQKQEQIIRAWIGFHQLRFNLNKLTQLINNQQIKTKIFMGKYDKLLPTNRVFPLTKRLKNVELIELEATHRNLIEKVTNYLKNS
ncbi:MAG: alpha/beta hydrolase [Arcicella sp.]|nr:alpha/beta hydrolase [Arcicella sp.]